MPPGEQCLGVQIQVSMYFGLGGFSHNKHCALPAEAGLLAFGQRSMCRFLSVENFFLRRLSEGT